MSEISPDRSEINTEDSFERPFSDTGIKVRMIIGLILVFLLSGLCGWMVSRYTVRQQELKLQTIENERADKAAYAIGEVLEDEQAAKDSFIAHMRRSADLSQSLLMPYVNADNVYTGPETFEDGVVIRLENGTVRWPEGFHDANMILPENFPDLEEDYFYTTLSPEDAVREAAVAYRQLATGTWYLEWTFTDEEEAFLDANLSRDTHIAAIEAVSNGWFVLVDDQTGEAVYNHFALADEMIETAAEAARNGTTISDDYSEYRVLSRSLQDKGKTILFLNPVLDDYKTAKTEALIIGLLVFLILAVLFVWLASTQWMVVCHVLTKPQTARYNPKAMRRRTAAAGAFCLILLFVSALFIRTAGKLFNESQTYSGMLEKYQVSLEVLQNNENTAAVEEQEWILYYAKKAAAQLSASPDLIDYVRLSTVNADIGSEYIMIFDENGNETACSGDYIHFTLGNNENDQLYTFRRINKGLESVITEPARDIILDKDTILVGVRMDQPDTEGYGVMLISFDAKNVNPADPERDEARLMTASVYDGSLIFSLDSEKTKIQNSSMPYYTGIDLETLGLEEKVLKESDMSQFRLFKGEYNGASRLIDGRLYFYANSKVTVDHSTVSFAVMCTLLAAVSFAILAFLLLYGYTQESFEKFAVVGTEAVRGSSVEVITPDGKIKRTRDPSKRRDLSMQSWKDLLPESKTKITAQLILLVYLAAAMSVLWQAEKDHTTIVTYLLSDTWERGFNLLALSANILIAGAAVLAMMFIRILIQLISTWLDTKGETILRLLYNLLQYIALFTVLFYSFSNFGVDTSALLTTMGLLSLAVSIGARDLVADVIAGITIVMEGDYQVGDIVEIDGYRGKVQEIGVRSTKIMGMGDNIKTVNNRDVRNVINTTRFNSWYAMTLNIASTYDINKLEDILEAELPQIRQRMKKVISGPVYRGVESIGKDSFKITILTECREEDYRWVQRQINREIRILFDREGIPII